MGKTLFADAPDSPYRLLAALLVASGILFTDLRTDWLAPVRSSLALVTEPVTSAVDFPRRAALAVADSFTTRSTLAEENARLAQENLVLQRHVQRLAALTAENVRLRELLDSSALLDSRVLVAEVIGYEPDPSRQEVILDKGANVGIQVGQPVLDAGGVLGQVIEVGPRLARVMLLTDSRHAIPVEVNRNGLRTIAGGGGRAGVLQLQYLPATAEVQVGDQLVSSGLGGVFPRGYPVGEVVAMRHEPADVFLTVTVRPAAAFNRSRQVLVLFEQSAAAAAGVGR